MSCHIHMQLQLEPRQFSQCFNRSMTAFTGSVHSLTTHALFQPVCSNIVPVQRVVWLALSQRASGIAFSLPTRSAMLHIACGIPSSAHNRREIGTGGAAFPITKACCKSTAFTSYTSALTHSCAALYIHHMCFSNTCAAMQPGHRRE